MCFGPEVEMWRQGVFEELNGEIAAQQKGHCAHNSAGGSFTMKRSGPNSDSFRQNFDEDRGQHKARTERNQVFEEAFAQSMSAGLNENNASDDISAGSKQAEQQKPPEFEIAEDGFHSAAVTDSIN